MRAHTHAHNNAKGPSACSRGVRRPLAGQEVGPRARGARAAVLHVPPGRGGTLDDPNCPAAVRSGQWGSGAQDTQRSTAIATTTCLPRKVHIIVRISSRTQRGSPRSLPDSKYIASEVPERVEAPAAGTCPHLGASSRSGPGVGGASPSSSTAALAAPALAARSASTTRRGQRRSRLLLLLNLGKSLRCLW